MNNDKNAGTDPRSLLMLGGLAALALNRDLRRNVVGGTRHALEGAQQTLHGALEDTVKPALSTAAVHAQHAAQEAARRGASTLGDLREDVPERAQSLLHTAASVAGQVAHSAQDRAAHLAHDAQDLAEQRRRQARKAAGAARHEANEHLTDAREAGAHLLSALSSGVQHLIGTAGDDLEDRRRETARALTAARRDAERELRRHRKTWNAAKLEREIARRVAPVQKKVNRELALIDREASRRAGSLKRDLSAVKRAQAPQAHAPQKRGGLGGLTTVVLLSAGAVALARMPAVRRGILDAVDTVSPEAARNLHTYSRKARNLIGTAWLQTVEEDKQTAAPGVAAKTQGGTTGATWGASPAPDSSAAAKTQAEEHKTGPQGDAGAGRTTENKPNT